MKLRTRGVLALSLTGILFGTTFIVVGAAIERADVAPFLAVRFLVAALVLAPLAFRRPSTPGVVRDGVLAGSCLLIAYALQTVGLHDTSPASSAFITYLLVVFVPLFTAVRTRRPPTPPILVGVTLAVVGLWILSGGVAGFGRGELLTLGCAVFFGLHIIVLGEVAHRHDPFRFTFWQIATVSIACFVPPVVGGGDIAAAFRFDSGVWAAIVVCGIGATAIAFWCMSWAQTVVPVSLAAIVLLLEPVSAAFLDELTGESLGWRGATGAVVILAAVIVTELLGRNEPAVIGAEVAVFTGEAPAHLGDEPASGGAGGATSTIEADPMAPAATASGGVEAADSVQPSAS